MAGALPAIGSALIGGAVSAGVGYGINALMPRPRAPAMPTMPAIPQIQQQQPQAITIQLPSEKRPETPATPNTPTVDMEPTPPPEVPTGTTLTAAQQRARSRRAEPSAGNRDIVLTTARSRQRELEGTVQRTSLLGS